MTKDSQQTSANQTSSCEEASHVKMPYNNYAGFLEKFKRLQKVATTKKCDAKTAPAHHVEWYEHQVS